MSSVLDIPRRASFSSGVVRWGAESRSGCDLYPVDVLIESASSVDATWLVRLRRGWGPVSSSLGEPKAPGEPSEKVAPVPRKSDAELIRSLRERSGLTWELLARALGVSRRSLHMWAAGATVTAAHRAVMERFERLLDGHGPSSPADTRAWLFDRGANGEAPIDSFRASRDGGKREINGPVLTASEML